MAAGPQIAATGAETSASTGRRLPVRRLLDQCLVLAVAEPPRRGQQRRLVDIPHAIGDLLDAGDFEPLTHLDGADELDGLEQILERAHIEPDKPATALFDVQRAALEIDVVEVGDFERAEGTRLDAISITSRS